MNVRTRIERLESTRQQLQRLVLIAPDGVLTEVQRAQLQAAERAGHDPLVIAIMARYGNASTAGAAA